MENNIVGVIGIDSYELTIAYGHICKSMGEKVLLVDCSMEQSLVACLPTLREINIKEEIQEWIGLYYTSMDMNEIKELEFDRIFLYFGMYFEKCYEEICNEYIWICDTKRYHQKKLTEYQETIDKLSHIVIKHMEYEIAEDVVRKMQLGIPRNKKIYSIAISSQIHEFCLWSENQQCIRKGALPKDMMEYFIDCIELWFPKLSIKHRKKLIRQLFIKNHYKYTFDHISVNGKKEEGV